jgi:hypothetical protein
MDYPAVDEDRHVLAQCRLVVEHIAARLRMIRNTASRTSRTVRPEASICGNATWR